MFDGPGPDWFEALTGFAETSFEETRSKLTVDQGRLRSLVNGHTYRVGALELPSLEALRIRAPLPADGKRHLKTSIVRGDVRSMHHDAANAGALFQVASQFNLLEMVSPEVSPADGVARYAHDLTQGPACAIAAGAATIYRNYFAQRPEQQIDTLAEVGAALSKALDTPLQSLWAMRNGYAMPSLAGLERISVHLENAEAAERDALRAKLRIGLHLDVEVTDAPGHDRPIVSQAFCSAMPVSYTYLDEDLWAPFASLVLEAAYEATLRAAALNASRGVSNVVFLTLLGGGAFGNRPLWILNAVKRALALAESADLDVRLVSYGAPWTPIRGLFEAP